MSRGTPSERFWMKVDKNGTIPQHRPELGPCWVWTAGTYTNGYGQFRDQPLHKGMAHRFSYELLVGPIPDGLEIDHLCRNPACVNPTHLEPVTGTVNKQRANNWQRRKTHCPQGHPYDEENTRYVKSKHLFRRCLICTRQNGRLQRRKYRLRKKQERLDGPAPSLTTS